MSISTKSRPASPSSPEAGHETSEHGEDGYEPRRPRAPGGSVEVELEPQHQRPLGWAVFGLVVGALLIWQLGTVAVWGGIVLVVVGSFGAWEALQSYLRPAGSIIVSEHEVVLPRGLHMTKPVTAPPDAVTAVYFLRKSVPWNRASPILIVELGSRAMAFPREWFASEADQRHVVHALLRSREAEAGAVARVGKTEVGGPIDDGRSSALAEMAAGAALVVLGTVISIAALPNFAIATKTEFVVGFAPIAIGAMLFWRGVTRLG